MVEELNSTPTKLLSYLNPFGCRWSVFPKICSAEHQLCELRLIDSTKKKSFCLCITLGCTELMVLIMLGFDCLWQSWSDSMLSPAPQAVSLTPLFSSYPQCLCSLPPFARRFPQMCVLEDQIKKKEVGREEKCFQQKARNLLDFSRKLETLLKYSWTMPLRSHHLWTIHQGQLQLQGKLGRIFFT